MSELPLDPAGLWVLLALCGGAGVLEEGLRRVRRGYYARHASWRDAPRAFAGAVVDAVMTGLGVGLSLALVLFAGAAVFIRVGL